jgi:hypothetical protein
MLKAYLAKRALLTNRRRLGCSKPQPVPCAGKSDLETNIAV